jgi:hypothetical protein
MKTFNLKVIVETLLSLEQFPDYVDQEKQLRAEEVRDFMNALMNAHNTKLYSKFWHELREQDSGKMGKDRFLQLFDELEEGERADITEWKALYLFYYPYAYKKLGIEYSKHLLTDFFVKVLTPEALVCAVQKIDFK